MSGFTLNIDLTLYFEDLRKFASIYVDNTKCKEVGDVENHIKTIFKLDDNICLTNKRFLIPRSESIHILQQYDTLKVQKCDFYDYQIHKNKKSNAPCDHPALNLVQSDRTIDLSCRPKQRLKINICQNHCVLESPKTVFDNAKLNNITQPVGISEQNCSDEINEIQTKHKSKSKKKRYDTQTEEDEFNNETTTKILDMSVDKSKKKKTSLADEKLQIFNDIPSIFPTHLEDSQEILHEYKRKSKKRKKHVEVEEEIDLANSCWENLVFEKGSDRKRKSKKNNFDIEFSDTMAKDLSLNVNSNIEVNEENDLNSYAYEESVVRKKQKSERKSELKNHRKSNSEYVGINNTNASTHSGTSSHKTDIVIDTTHRKLQNGDDYNKDIIVKSNILNQTNSELNCSNSMEVDESNVLNTTTITNDAQDYGDFNNVNGKLSCNEDKRLASFEDSIKVKSKRKRVRKHNSKKKRNGQEFLTAVGPVLNRIIEPPKISIVQNSPESAKHVFFTDDDFIDEIPIPVTPSNRSLLKGDSDGQENQSMSQDDATSNTCLTSDNTWQHNLMNLTMVTSKPLIFHRNGQSSLLVNKDSPPKSSTNSSMLSKPSMGKFQNDITASESNNGVVEYSEELNCVSKDVANCNGDITNLSNVVVDLKPSLKTSSINSIETKPDLNNVILTEYPIIDKIVAEDIILFKVHKLGDSYEPYCSKTILAKVKNVTNFPEKIPLQIMDGFEECSHLPKTEENGEKFTIELRWSEIVEPRLFYP